MRVCEDLQRVELGSEFLDANVYGVGRLPRPQVDFLKASEKGSKNQCVALLCLRSLGTDSLLVAGEAINIIVGHIE